MIFDKETFDDLYENNLILNSYYGGLVIGRSHQNGGIPVIIQKSEDIFECIAEIEGFEFIFNVAASSIFKNKVLEINNELSTLQNKFTVDELWVNLGVNHKELRYLDANISESETLFKTKYIWIHGTQFIMNKLSSLYYYDLLYSMNHECKEKISEFIG